jgi:hypoxanthine phosphoribosyltransferase
LARETEIIKIAHKSFRLYLTSEQIQLRVKELARRISDELADKEPVFLSVLNGAFFFTADIIREIDFDCEISFIRIKSYSGMNSTGRVDIQSGPLAELKGRHVVILEDIIDTGLTISELIKVIRDAGAASIRVAALLLKPTALQYDVPRDYIAFEVENKFLVGYGLDYNSKGRQHNAIYAAVESQD